MESKITNSGKSEYPCLKIFINAEGDTIVLFTSTKAGCCVYTTHPDNKLGDFSDAWGESAFVVFTGTIELSNN